MEPWLAESVWWHSLQALHGADGDLDVAVANVAKYRKVVD